MLVLGRRPGESFVLDGNISVRILSISGNQVSLGICAPREVLILRAELRERPAPTNTRHPDVTPSHERADELSGTPDPYDP